VSQRAYQRYKCPNSTSDSAASISRHLCNRQLIRSEFVNVSVDCDTDCDDRTSFQSASSKLLSAYEFLAYRLPIVFHRGRAAQLLRRCRFCLKRRLPAFPDVPRHASGAAAGIHIGLIPPVKRLRGFLHVVQIYPKLMPYDRSPEPSRPRLWIGLSSFAG